MPKSDEPRRSGIGRSTSVTNLVNQARQALEQEEAQAEGKDGRGKPGHSGQKGIDSAGRSKATYGISQAAQDIAREIAETEEISQADVVEVALRVLAQLHRAGKVDLYPFKTPARSLKATYRLEGLEELKLFLD